MFSRQEKAKSDYYAINKKNMKKKLCFIICALIFFTSIPKLEAQEVAKSTRTEIGNYLTNKVRKEVYVAPIQIDSVKVEKKTVRLYANVNLSYISFTKEKTDEIYSQVKALLPKEYNKYKLEIYSDGYRIEDYIPLNRKDKFKNKVKTALVTNSSHPLVFEKGLSNRHLALWQSHGWYYEQKLGRWEWQRARIFQTVEDLYTQSYVLPYLVPMLENSGANVLLPRERDTQSHEIIIDNDKSIGLSTYKEYTGKEKWNSGTGIGFAHLKDYYLDGENPFKAGTFRQVKTVKDNESTCEWIPDMPEKGKYAVYVSYKTLENSTEDAQYTIYHLGGKTEFSINQQMGGGTWIFLGFFSFDKGVNDNCKIVLSNKSSKTGRIVTADAIKIGGGKGNIARLPHPEGKVTENTKSSEKIGANTVRDIPKINYIPETSGYPRYTEGARYWLQWAGAPDSIYNKSESKNDYTDDYQSRGYWVNYIAGGSSVNPKAEGLNIPIDLAMAFHSDAGTTYNDSIIGTLGICMTHFNDEKFANGKPRILSRDLTSCIMDEIVKDIRLEYEPDWTRRHIWNRSYSEARVPEVPTMLLELLSHQNFADMRYGLDPRFQFTVSRSIYKGMLKFIANQYNYEYVVQPLPVENFSVEFSGDTEISLKWKPTIDNSEPTAIPSKYILYTRVDDNDFDNGQLINSTNTKVTIKKDKIYSFRVAAINDGGESFPSEILSASRQSDEKGTVLVVNGFDRISAPMSFATKDSIGGFVDFIDHGVPDGKQYNYIGSQYEFRRRIPWMDDDAAGFGASNANFETTVVAGNTFDYPFTHGLAIAHNGYSFTSCSNEAVSDGDTDLSQYKLVDLILGKQKQTKIGRGVFPAEFKTFPKELQIKIAEYCNGGGNIFASGAYVASDLWDNKDATKEDKDFATNTLKYKWRVGQAAVEGKAKVVTSPFSSFAGNYEFFTKLNSTCYAVESPDALEPAGENSFTILRYSENNLSAGVASKGDYKTVVIGFPFEVIQDESQRNLLMNSILRFVFE